MRPPINVFIVLDNSVCLGMHVLISDLLFYIRYYNIQGDNHWVELSWVGLSCFGFSWVELSYVGLSWVKLSVFS